MAILIDLAGIHVPLITPLAADGSVALDNLERLAHESLDAGAAGLVALGTTGEPATLSAVERRCVVDVVGAVCGQRSATFLVGVGSNNTHEVAEMAAEIGALPNVSGLLSVVPYYTRPSQAGIVAHFRAVAAASPVPIVVYNIPHRTGRGLSAASLLELANVANIAGLKQSVQGIDQDTLALLAQAPPSFQVLAGDEAFLLPLLSLGGVGAIAACAHVCTAGFVALVKAVQKGDLVEARELSRLLLPVCEGLFAEPSPGVLKGVLVAQGRIGNPALRLPMTPGSAAAVATALGAVERADQAIARSLALT